MARPALGAAGAVVERDRAGPSNRTASRFPSPSVLPVIVIGCRGRQRVIPQPYGRSPTGVEPPMSTVEEITATIERLPAGDVARVRAWLAESADRLWDKPIERNERAGRLDALIDRALEEHRTGRTRPPVNHHTTAGFWECYYPGMKEGHIRAQRASE